jgi:hypothetical protein
MTYRFQTLRSQPFIHNIHGCLLHFSHESHLLGDSLARGPTRGRLGYDIIETVSLSTNQQRGYRFDKRELKYLRVLSGLMEGSFLLLINNTKNDINTRRKHNKLFQLSETQVHLQICLTRTPLPLSRTSTLLLELSSLLSVLSLATKVMWYVFIFNRSSLSAPYF